jgi:hypothetical protein
MDHFEVGVGLSDGTSSNGWSQVYQNGVLIANAQNIRFNADATQAARSLTLVEVGGWSSGPASPNVQRYIPEVRFAPTRQGVWAMANQ